MKQDEISSILDQALRYHRGNNIKRAGELYTELLEHDRYNVNALHLLGLVELSLKRYDRAEHYIHSAISLEPKQAVFYVNLGIVLQRQKKYAKAEALYLRAIQLSIDNDFDIYFNLGLVLAKQGKLKEAKLAYERSIELEPTSVKSYNNLAGVVLELADINAAIGYYTTALNLDPKAYRAANNLGNIYFNYCGDIEKATVFYQRAVAINIDFWEAKFNLANCYRLCNQQQRSIITFQTCLKQGDNNILSWYYLGVTYEKAGQIEQAIAAYTAVIKINPRFLPAISNLYHAKRKVCAWDGMDKLAALLGEVNSYIRDGAPNCIGEEPHINVLRIDKAQENKRVAVAWSDSIVYKMRGLAKNYNFSHLVNQERIKIGYIADTFWESDIAYLIKGMFKTHDRTSFDLYVYTYGFEDKSQFRSEIRQCADHFVELGNLDYVAAADKIYADGIQILIDLTGHAKNNKLEIMALKPAPIQINYLGYPGTTGAKFIDYIILDKIVLQEDELDDYSENIILMPDSYQPTDRWQSIAVDYVCRKQFGLQDDHLVLAVFSNNEHIEPSIFHIWMKVLKKVPNSILICYIEHEQAGNNIKQAVKDHSINEKRVQFVTKISKEQHLSRLKIVDLVLDTRLGNDPIATTDALWAGVPVITLYGNHFASRISASLLAAIGLQECIASTLEEYEACVLEYALDPAKLAALKQQLLANKLKLPLFDTELQCRNLEKAFKYIWRAYVHDEQQQVIDVADI